MRKKYGGTLWTGPQGEHGKHSSRMQISAATMVTEWSHSKSTSPKKSTPHRGVPAVFPWRFWDNPTRRLISDPARCGWMLLCKIAVPRNTGTFNVTTLWLALHSWTKKPDYLAKPRPTKNQQGKPSVFHELPAISSLKGPLLGKFQHSSAAWRPAGSIHIHTHTICTDFLSYYHTCVFHVYAQYDFSYV